MANVFGAVEVIDMGIEKEKRRRDFYGMVAKKFSEKAMKDLFARLRDWEDTHIKKFRQIRSGVEESETMESYSGEARTYMQSIVDDKLYKEVSPKSFSKNVRTPIKAIRYGIIFEKDAILFFGELLKYMTSHHVEKIQELIGEEKKHLIYLSKLKHDYE